MPLENLALRFANRTVAPYACPELPGAAYATSFMQPPDSVLRRTTIGNKNILLHERSPSKQPYVRKLMLIVMRGVNYE
jgi:hypothetical protein